MARIVIVGTSDACRTQLPRLLASSGYGVFRICAAGGELRRTLDACEDCIVIIVGAAPPDCLPDALADDFGDRSQILLIARPGTLSQCESRKVFKLSYPCSGSTIIGAIEMLSQLHAMRLPHRTEDEAALVDRAKRLLMAADGIGEPEAHRRMQQYAMRHGIRLIDYAMQLLQGGSDHA